MNRVRLISIDVSKPEKVIKFNISHNDGTTTLDQDLIITRNPDGSWSADIKFENFPEQNRPQDAVNKLAQWMGRLIETMLNHNFDTIDLQKDLVR